MDALLKDSIIKVNFATVVGVVMRVYQFMLTMYAHQFMLPFGCLFIRNLYFEQLLDVRHSMGCD